MPEFVIVSADSGTFFHADDAYILNVDHLTPHEVELLNEGCDSERCELAREHGHPVLEVTHTNSL